jgi:hypothetical protein
LSDPVDALILDLLEWIGPRPRPYAEVIDVWRTSCPRLPVWEEANARGLLAHSRPDEGGTWIALSAAGVALLASERQRSFPVAT